MPVVLSKKAKKRARALLGAVYDAWMEGIEPDYIRWLVNEELEQRPVYFDEPLGVVKAADGIEYAVMCRDIQRDLPDGRQLSNLIVEPSPVDTNGDRIGLLVIEPAVSEEGGPVFPMFCQRDFVRGRMPVSDDEIARADWVNLETGEPAVMRGGLPYTPDGQK